VETPFQTYEVEKLEIKNGFNVSPVTVVVSPNGPLAVIAKPVTADVESPVEYPTDDAAPVLDVAKDIFLVSIWGMLAEI
jgi:hypothetical protein